MNYLQLITSLIQRIGDEDLKRCVDQLFKDPKMRVCEDIEPLVGLEESPAAPRKHHMYRGGLLQHTYGVAVLAASLADVIRNVYGVDVDLDLVIAAALLHDLYKFYQYEFDNEERCFKPRKDWYLSHDYAVVAEVAKRGCPAKLIRVLSEVHGTVPITTLEGLIVHLADSVDARLGEFLQEVVISVLKDVEKKTGCKCTVLLDEMVTRMGFNELLKKALSGELMSLAEEICREILGMNTEQD